MEHSDSASEAKSQRKKNALTFQRVRESACYLRACQWLDPKDAQAWRRSAENSVVRLGGKGMMEKRCRIAMLAVCLTMLLVRRQFRPEGEVAGNWPELCVVLGDLKLCRGLEVFCVKSEAGRTGKSM